MSHWKTFFTTLPRKSPFIGLATWYFRWILVKWNQRWLGSWSLAFSSHSMFMYLDLHLLKVNKSTYLSNESVNHSFPKRLFISQEAVFILQGGSPSPKKEHVCSFDLPSHKEGIRTHTHPHTWTMNQSIPLFGKIPSVWTTGNWVTCFLRKIHNHPFVRGILICLCHQKVWCACVCWTWC